MKYKLFAVPKDAMKRCSRGFALITIAFSCAAVAQIAPGQRDQRAVDVLKAMDAQLEAMQNFVVETESYRDAVYDGATIISNPSRSTVTVERGASLHALTNDGESIKEIYFHDGGLTVFDKQNSFYAKADVPKVLKNGLLFALDNLDIETPLIDLLVVDSLNSFASDIDAVVYLTNKAPIRGVDCHHILISGPQVELQLFIQEGDQPLPRRSVMTFKAALGNPRQEVLMDWRELEEINASVFQFKPPSGAREIEFATAGQTEGE